MKKDTYQSKEIREELAGHMADIVEDLVAEGLSRAAAVKKAEAMFGDLDAIEQNVLALHRNFSWVRWNPVSMLAVGYLVLLLLLMVSTYGSYETVAGTYLEIVTVLWIYGAIVGLGLVLSYWLTDFFGWKTMKGFLISTVIVQLLALSLTIIFDVDKFEVNIHAIAFSTILLASGRILWPRLNIMMKQILVYGQVAVVLRSIILHEAIFSYIAKPGCWFITPDNVPLTGALSYCTQVTWSSPMLFPIYVTLLGGASYLGYFLWKVWQNRGTKLYRKIIISCSCAGMIIAPLTFQDLNNEARLDIIPSKAAIYNMYDETLGRAPTSAELEFYALTRSYEHMSKMQEVLMASEERRLKINLLYQAAQHREASDQEITEHNEQSQTISEIQQKINN